MRVAVLCEYSGLVRDAFIANGHDAISCDLLPTERPGPHFTGKVEDFVKVSGKFDLIIGHPPCTFLTVANTYMTRGCSKYTKEEAVLLRKEAVNFFMFMVNLDCKNIGLENPIGIMSTLYRKPDQIIQPWEFGHPESKATCLWLKGLPPLKPTTYALFTHYRCRCGNVFSYEAGKFGCCKTAAKPLWNNQTPSGQNKLGPSADRAKIRSKTYEGIAQAMADQWGKRKAVPMQLKLAV